jgi:Arc/MetJ-type ribon-helix-helix transcriptional regulator
MAERGGDASEQVRQHVRRIIAQLRTRRDKTREEKPTIAEPIDRSVEVNRESDASSGSAGHLKRPS